jgi:hypothetical protein
MNPMIEILIFTLNAILIYFVADWIVRMIEARRGEVLKQRQIVFFAVFLVLALVTFRLLRILLTS